MTETEIIQEQVEQLLTVKPEARILDATAGNRQIWLVKESPYVLWMDLEPELAIKPDLIGNCINTNFPDTFFDAIFFDPPHWWGDEIGKNRYAIGNKSDVEYFKQIYKTGLVSHPSYYGTDKIKSRTELLTFLHRSQLEFYRILKDSGMLWVKWVEAKIELQRILPFFKTWLLMMKFDIGSKKQTQSEMQCYWLMFMKKPLGPFIQTSLSKETEP